MSAMHWEARRRQSALDRRVLQVKQELVDKVSDTCSATNPDTTQQQTVVSQCPHCNSNTKTSLHHSGKIPNRYSSLHYSQQW